MVEAAGAGAAEERAAGAERGDAAERGDGVERGAVDFGAGAGRISTTGLDSCTGRAGSSEAFVSAAGAGAAFASAAGAGPGSGVAGAGCGAGAAGGGLEEPFRDGLDGLEDLADLEDFDLDGAAWTAGAASTSSAERRPQQTRGSGWNMLRERRGSSTGDSGAGDTEREGLLRNGPPPGPHPEHGRRKGQRGLSRGGGGTTSCRRPARTPAPERHRWRSNPPPLSARCCQ